MRRPPAPPLSGFIIISTDKATPKSSSNNLNYESGGPMKWNIPCSTNACSYLEIAHRLLSKITRLKQSLVRLCEIVEALHWPSRTVPKLKDGTREAKCLWKFGARRRSRSAPPLPHPGLQGRLDWWMEGRRTDRRDSNGIGIWETEDGHNEPMFRDGEVTLRTWTT